MRSLTLLLCLITASATAQPSSPPVTAEPILPPPLISAPDPPPAPTESPTAPPQAPSPTSEVPPTPREEPTLEPALPPPPLPGYTGPALPASERIPRYVDPGRHGSFSAGPGGVPLVLTELISGVIAGGLLGAAPGGPGAFPGLMLGGLTLGTTAALYQYFVRVEENEGWLIAGAATAGFITGFGVPSERGMSRGDRGLLTLAATQLAVISTLAITLRDPGDVSSGDTALIGTTSLYAFLLTGLVQLTLDEPDTETDATPTFLAPTLGLLAGALLAVPLELDAMAVLTVATLPVFTGLVMLRIGENLPSQTFAPAMLITVAGTFAVTAALVFLFPDQMVPKESSDDSTLHAIPAPMVMPAGRGNDSLAAGPGLLMRF